MTAPFLTKFEFELCDRFLLLFI